MAQGCTCFYVSFKFFYLKSTVSILFDQGVEKKMLMFGKNEQNIEPDFGNTK